MSLRPPVHRVASVIISSSRAGSLLASAPRRPFPTGRPCRIIELDEPGACHHSWFFAASAAESMGDSPGRRGAAEAGEVGGPPRGVGAPAAAAKARKPLRLRWLSRDSVY